MKQFIRAKGFTLVEIIIVIAIVMILVTMATPNILRSRRVATEGAALGNLRTISNACQIYHINNDTFAASLLAMSQTTPAYIDSELASGTKQRYQFIYTLVNADQFTCNANPTSVGVLRGRYFYVDENGIITSHPTRPARPTDPPA